MGALRATCTGSGFPGATQTGLQNDDPADDGAQRAGERGVCVVNYSICMLDSTGRTVRSEFEPFANDQDAIARGRTELPATAIVEVWKAEHLIARLFQDGSA